MHFQMPAISVSIEDTIPPNLSEEEMSPVSTADSISLAGGAMQNIDLRCVDKPEDLLEETSEMNEREGDNANNLIEQQTRRKQSNSAVRVTVMAALYAVKSV